MKLRLAVASSILSLLVLSSACGGGGDAESDPLDGATGVVFAKPSSDSATTVSVRTGGLTLTIHTEYTWRSGNGQMNLVMHGAASKNLSFVQGFIPDDKWGDVTMTGPRSFDLVFSSLSDQNTVLSGSRYYLELETTSSGTTQDFSAAIDTMPHLVSTSGSSRIAFGPLVEPVAATAGLTYRGTVTTTAIPQSLTVTDGTSSPTLTADGPRSWHFDWDFDTFRAAAIAATPVEAVGKFGATTSKRDGSISIRVVQIGLAPGSSPDDAFNAPQSCDPDVLACLKTLPASTTDFSACGAYQPVSICLDEDGFPPAQ